MDVTYSTDGAGAFLGLVALGVARGMSIDAAAAKAHEVWAQKVREHSAVWSADELTEIAREASGG
ncbi:MAG: hypothetical protein ACT4PI_10540 [Actinomycetota bacterium]